MSTISTIPEDFEVNTKSNYLRLTPGKHRIRILSDALVGYEWWEDTPEGGRKPMRIPMDGRPPVEYAESVKRFLAFSVFNQDLNCIQIWEVTQTSIQKELKALESDKDWGSLKDYDLEVERTGTEKNTTKYRVTPKPKAELSKEAQKIVKDGLPVLEALFKGENPFEYNPLAEEENEQAPLF